jgi:glycosyltransferase involved in cell wall biosynthesis
MPTSAQQPDLSVIIPCYNEQKNLEEGVLDEVHQYLTKQDYAWEVIIVNDESTDDSKSLITAFIENRENFCLFDIPHGGKPAAVWAGIQKAKGEIVLFTDMDQSTPISELSKLLPWYEKGFDVVIGSRGMTREGFSLLRKLGSVAFRTLRSLFLLRDINDTQCGFKSCRRQVAIEVFPRLQFFKQKEKPTGWKVSAYDVELLYLLEKVGYRIKEVVVEWSNRDQSDTKSQTGEFAQYLNESIDMAKEILRVRINQRKGLYDEE